MKLIIFITNRESALRAVTQFIPADYLLLEGTAGQKGLKMISEITSGVVLVDCSLPEVPAWLEEARRLRPDLTYLGLADETAENLPPQEVGAFYDFIRAPFQPLKIRPVLERALERERLQQEIAYYQKTHTAPPTTLQAGSFMPENHSFPAGSAVNPGVIPANPAGHSNRGRVLGEFSRALNNNFDRDRLLDLFMNAVLELVPVGKLSILLYTENVTEYKIAAQRGLDPTLCAGLRFKPFAGLISWLAREGRILQAGEANTFPAAAAADISQAMQLLQAVICIPLLAQGRLVGTLNLGSKITGASFTGEELETLYIFCGNVAVALRDIELHHQIRSQKLYIENVLQHMNSGIVAIDKEERIITFNPRAGEILALTPEKIMGKDLRLLPSPLGDLLYETLITGETLRKQEIEPVYNNIPLEVNTYRLLNDAGEPLGSVMIFDDLSPRKMLEKEKRRAAQLDVLNKFVGQLAHEIKNPMVAVQTFAELLPEKYGDRSFRDFYALTVQQELKRLNELIEQLIAFSAPLAYDFKINELHEILNLGLSFLQEQGWGQKTAVETEFGFHSLQVRSDKILLARAFSYLIRHLFRAVEEGGVVRMKTAPADQNVPKGPGGSVCISLCDLKTKTVPENINNMFDPLAAHPNGYFSLGPPVGRKIIEDHGGLVKASLTKERYLEVEVHLPIFTGKED